MPQADRRCSSLTKTGKPCPNRPMADEDVCLMHSPRGEETRAKGRARAAAAKRELVEARKQAAEDAKLTLTQRLHRRAAERANEVVSALVRAAEGGDMRAQTILWERVEGKVADKLETRASDPFEMDVAALQRWLMESEAREGEHESEDSTVPTPLDHPSQEG